MKIYCLRLRPGQDLKKELANFVVEKNIQAGFIVTTVGSFKKACLRMANGKETKIFKKKFEITSLVGTLCKDGLHLHVSLSDKKGRCLGGHLKDGCIIYTTAEIIIGDSTDYVFTRKFDSQTNFKELIIKNND